MDLDDFKIFSESIFWDFKRRDNVEYNFQIILFLATFIVNNQHGSPLRFKPICITIASILECTMYDFLTRVKQHTNEKIPSLDDETIKTIKDINLPNPFSKYNALFRKNKILGDNNQAYDDIDRLIEIRNRVHVQNIKGNLPKDEEELWSHEVVNFFGSTLKSVYEYLTSSYPRPGANRINENNSFPEPWKDLA